jgi:uncharacterized protein YkwD
MAFSWFRPRSVRPRPAAGIRLHVEGMEERACPSAVAVLSNRILTVRGSSVADVINVGASGTNILAGGRAFAAAGVDRIVVAAEGGNDRVTVAEAVTKPTGIFGGTGNDTVSGGSGADEIYGGHGADTLSGRGGADVIYGGPATDVLDGGAGGNTLVQGSPSRTDSSNSAIEQEILRLTNVERARFGLPALRLSGQLNYMAGVQAANMAARSALVGAAAALSHTLNGTGTPTLSSRADYAGYEYRSLAENIAYGPWTAAQVVRAWMNSAGHRANILNPGLTEIGVGAATNPAGMKFFCQAFGTRL